MHGKIYISHTTAIFFFYVKFVRFKAVDQSHGTSSVNESFNRVWKSIRCTNLSFIVQCEPFNMLVYRYLINGKTTLRLYQSLKPTKHPMRVFNDVIVSLWNFIRVSKYSFCLPTPDESLILHKYNKLNVSNASTRKPKPYLCTHLFSNKSFIRVLLLFKKWRFYVW